ncbi:hypothetical protein J437_LFUL017859 [Ladona fulva]|uniref:Cadherin domain-containing protein n=1 Tax=Ladona fulva TaxID=123851 RepID=A0A8K0KLT9_LADFU|nr:hypothetical protein J437_LFUL017859 [Ladona fulva]
MRHSRHLGGVSSSHMSSFPEALHSADYRLGGSHNSVIDAGTSSIIIQNNHKPVFRNCSRYEPTVNEEEPIGTFVFKVVRATDNGRPKLDDVCTIKVSILDINDNAPVFDKAKYLESVPQDLSPAREVMRISATDIDDGNNGVVEYFLETSKDEDRGYFQIDRSTGLITLNKTIDTNKLNTFILESEEQKAHIKLGRRLDYESITEYFLTVRVENKFKLAAEAVVHIKVEDVNDNIPYFTEVVSGSVLEHEPPGTPVMQVKAIDADGTSAHSLVQYQLSDHEDLFSIDPMTGNITTRVEFDREKTDFYNVKVIAYDNSPSALLTDGSPNKGQQVFSIEIADKNDNPPRFTSKHYIAEAISEDANLHSVVTEVKANDNDTVLVLAVVVNRKKRDDLLKDTDDIRETIINYEDEGGGEGDMTGYDLNVLRLPNSGLGLKGKKGPLGDDDDDYDDDDDDPRKETRPLGRGPDDVPDICGFLVDKKAAVDKDPDTSPYDDVRHYAYEGDGNSTGSLSSLASASLIVYSIIDGNTFDSFYMENITGKIRVNTRLDYENTTSYTLRVKASDGIYEDTADVEIRIENVNDNRPVFLPYVKNVTIKEESLVEGCIANLKAYDPDIQDREALQHIVYFIVKEEQQKLLSINNEGCLSLTKPLDRDPPNGYSSWQVLITAKDEDGGPSSLSESTEVVISLIDINDNAPYLDMVQPVVWNEQQDPGVITQLKAEDNDSEENGPPFRFTLEDAAEDIRTKFSIKDSNLVAQVTFDREDKKYYLIPITIIDSGDPPMTGTSTLTLVIGDINDNPMQSGSSSIFVYNYKGEAPAMDIGRVYVEDLDDWDLPDKTFIWSGIGKHPNFDLNPNTGMLTLFPKTPNGTYHLEFKVTEESEHIQRHSVDAYVNVTVKEIPEIAVDNSGSIRFSGITAEDFVSSKQGISKRDLLQDKLANILNVSRSNVDVFTVLHSPHHPAPSPFSIPSPSDPPPLLDVRFSAHGSPYYHPEKVNSMVSKHMTDLERALDAEIQMVSIDECLVEKAICESSCINVLSKSSTPSVVFTNVSSFVGVKAIVDPLCECLAPHNEIHCLNGGTPVGRGKCSGVWGTDEGDLNFDYLSSFGPRFRKLADMYGEHSSDEEEDQYNQMGSESWC